MKLATFVPEAQSGIVARIGSVVDDSLIDLTTSYAAWLAERGASDPAGRASSVVPPDMLELLRGEEASMQAARTAHEFGSTVDRTVGVEGRPLQYALDDVRLRSPLPLPNSLRDFVGFEEHVKNGFESYDMDVPENWYELPVSYKGNPDAVIDPGSTLDWPPFTEKLDYELELAAVIGRRGRNVTADEAEAYIAGYTIFNDFSARDIQAREIDVRMGPGKGKDFANGLGPYLVTPDEFDVTDARMTARINGSQWSEGTTADMYYSFGDMIEYISWGQTIYPGDVYGSGTVPLGCGKGLGRWIEPGDVVELEVEGIGVLEHTIGEQTEQVTRDFVTEYEFDHR
jgi:2-keto-4-pentenoate hydratase/2-oxohepta-3-ene-1,7-dioic acid hydratase in catechol pathway